MGVLEWGRGGPRCVHGAGDLRLGPGVGGVGGRLHLTVVLALVGWGRGVHVGGGVGRGAHGVDRRVVHHLLLGVGVHHVLGWGVFRPGLGGHVARVGRAAAHVPGVVVPVHVLAHVLATVLVLVWGVGAAVVPIGHVLLLHLVVGIVVRAGGGDGVVGRVGVGLVPSRLAVSSSLKRNIS